MTDAQKSMKAAHRCVLIAGVSALFGITLGVSAQTSTVRNRVSQKTLPKLTTSSATELPQLKGILEPVNYGQDVKLTDVFFTSVDEGWVSGEHATILHTVDGGKTWTAQVGGDAYNDEKPIAQLRFLDQKRGWAIQDEHRLIRTLDGQNWDQISANLSPVVDYAFVSVRHGILLEGNTGGFSVTDDGGRHWRVVSPCQFTANVQGLAQKTDCHFLKLQMLSPRSGLALAMGNADHWLAVFRTNDAGEHWSYVAASLDDCCNLFSPPSGFFIDASHGVLVFGNRKTYLTADGGRSWHVLLSGGVGVDNGKLRFSDPQVGWVIGDNYRDLVKVSYTTDAGQHWSLSAPIKLPADQVKELTFSFPRRDRAYIVGPHGMVYRYSIVPASHVSSSVSPGPLMPGFDTAGITTAADRVDQDIARLQVQIASAGAGTVSSSPGTASTSAQTASSVPSSAGGGFTRDASTVDTSVQQTQTATPDGSAAGGFKQDTGPATAYFSDPTDANLTQGFTQSVDTSTPSAPLQSCCAPALQSLQTNLMGFNQAAALNSTHFRSLNLIIAGVQLVTNLLNQTQQLRASFTALKRAPTLQAASGILQQLANTMNSAQQSISTGFQNPGGWFASNAPAGFTQDLGPGAAGMGSATPGGAAESFSAAAPDGAAFTSTTAGSVAANANTSQQGVAFAAIIQGGANTPLPTATAQIVAANTKSQDLNALAADQTVLQSLQQGAAGAVQQAASGMSPGAANSLSTAAGGLVGGLFKKRNSTVVYLWGLPNANSVSTVSNTPVLQLNYTSIPRVNASDYAPAIIRLVPAQNGWFLVGAAKGQVGALQSSSADWDVYSSFSEQRIPAHVNQAGPGQATIQPAQPLASGPYAIVLRPVARSKKFSGADLAGLQGDGLAFNSVWPFVVSANATP